MIVICTKCGEGKELGPKNFFMRKKPDRWYKQCKECMKASNRVRWAQNKDSYNAKQKDYYKENKEYFREYAKEYWASNKDRLSANKRQYYQDNKGYFTRKSREYMKDRRANDLLFRIKSNVSRSVHKLLKSKGLSKNGKSVLKHLPYTLVELKAHLESLFESWMSWDNWGKYNPMIWSDDNQLTWTWQIDHIIPHSEFNYTSLSDEAFRKCWSLDNLRPLGAKKNFLDGIRRVRHS